MPEAARTLVKSPPELWAEISDPEALARHLGAFGEIRITRLDPESTVAWEGTRARGTVDLEPAGWGTKVTVTAEEIDAPELHEDVPAEPAPTPTPSRTTATADAPDEAPRRVHPTPATEPGGNAGSDVADPSDAAPTRGVRGLFARLFGRREEAVAEREREEAVEEREPAPAVEPQREPVASVASVEQPTVELVIPEVEPAITDRRSPGEVLDAMLASLGSARHRPFSRD